MRRSHFFILAVTNVATLAAQNFDGARAAIRQQLDADGVPSIAVSVARNGKIVWEEGFGWADRGKRLAADANTLYSLASISKPFTATGIMLLRKAGKIDLDLPANNYLGEAKLRAMLGDAKDATVRRVANHSAGLPLHYQFFYEDEPVRPPSMDETIHRYGILVTPPGEHYEYSNLGYGILGYLIQRVSGKSYEAFMQSEVFAPLGLEHTYVGVPAELASKQALRYGTDGQPLSFYDFDHRGASAIYSSAHDLVRFGMFHLKAHLPAQKSILDDDSIDSMKIPTIQTSGNLGYGIGWMINQRNGYTTVYHTGSMGGVRTLLLLVPAKQIAVVVLCNSYSGAPARIADDMLAAMLPDWKPQPPAPPASQVFHPPAELIGAWQGKVITWQNERVFTLNVEAAGELRAQLGDRVEATLRDVRWKDGYLTGQLDGDVGTDDSMRHRHTLTLQVKLRIDKLTGALTAVSKPDVRPGSALSSWVELKRAVK